MKLQFFPIIISILLFGCSNKKDNSFEIIFDSNSEHQTMHSFGASDCWRTQFIGKNWPIEKRDSIAQLLFSTAFNSDGHPEGIGLSLWRFNIGSGSHEAGDKSGVHSEWRRTESFLDENGNWDWSKQEGQRWFLTAAKEYHVPYTLGFSITAPYFMTKNGMTRASERTKHANIRDDKYGDYADFLALVSKKLELDYLSPINEPQWEWVGSSQEGMQATNEECAKLIKKLDKSFHQNDVKTKIVFGEAGDIRYLYRKTADKPDRDNQIEEMFSANGKHSIANLESVAPIVAGHSYWSTWPIDTMVTTRSELKLAMERELPTNFEYWQTEYCPMEQNPDNPQGGNGRDLGMNTALYILRVLHYDLTVANATSWQSWTAFSEWDYKDALIYIDDGVLASGASKGNEPMIESCKYDGVFRTSKYLWALGNYSLFVRPGMVRIGSVENKQEHENSELLYSAYVDKSTGKKVIVLTNMSDKELKVQFRFKNSKSKFNEKFSVYETSVGKDLEFTGKVRKKLTVSSRSVITLVSE